jgi:hypothetical protein
MIFRGFIAFPNHATGVSNHVLMLRHLDWIFIADTNLGAAWRVAPAHEV